MDQVTNKIMLSVVIPVFNESESVGTLLYELYQVLRSLDVDRFEVILIDDGSSDGSLAIIKECQPQYENLHYISFSRNYGHQNALMAGLHASRGDLVVTMDGDLQHPPALIHEMLAISKEGYDIVCTIRLPDRSLGKLKKMSSTFFYWLINKISDVKIKQGSADFRLLHRKVVDELKKIQEYDIFYRGMVAWLGFKQYELTYSPSSRRHGVSKYSLFKMIRLAIAGITSFSVFPLRISALSGFVVAGVSFIYGIYAVMIKVFGMEVVSGWASIMAGLYFLGGIQLIAIGLCGEYIGKVLMEVKHRPHYIIAESSIPTDTRP